MIDISKKQISDELKDWFFIPQSEEEIQKGYKNYEDKKKAMRKYAKKKREEDKNANKERADDTEKKNK